MKNGDGRREARLQNISLKDGYSDAVSRAYYLFYAASTFSFKGFILKLIRVLSIWP